MRWSLVASALLISCAAIGGWQARNLHDAQSCRYLASPPSVYNGYISRLPSLTRDVSPSVIANIYRCWALHSETTMGRQMRLEDARKLTGSTYLLAFGIWGVSDASLLFVIDADGTVMKAYGYPYTL